MNVALLLNNIFDTLLKRKKCALSFNSSEKEFFIYFFFPQELGASPSHFCVKSIHILKQSISHISQYEIKTQGF